MQLFNQYHECILIMYNYIVSVIIVYLSLYIYISYRFILYYIVFTFFCLSQVLEPSAPLKIQTLEPPSFLSAPTLGASKRARDPNRPLAVNQTSTKSHLVHHAKMGEHGGKFQETCKILYMEHEFKQGTMVLNRFETFKHVLIYKTADRNGLLTLKIWGFNLELTWINILQKSPKVGSIKSILTPTLGFQPNISQQRRQVQPKRKGLVAGSCGCATRQFFLKGGSHRIWTGRLQFQVRLLFSKIPCARWCYNDLERLLNHSSDTYGMIRNIHVWLVFW